MAKMKLRLWVSVAILSVSAAVAQAQTLADTMTMAYRNSGLLEQNRALLRAADEDLAQAVAALQPIINWSGEVKTTRIIGQAPAGSTVVRGAGGALELVEYPARGFVQTETTAQIALSGQLLLHDFGASGAGVSAARELVLATRASLLSVEQTVLLRAVQAHLNVRRAQEVLAVRRSNVTLLEQQLTAVRQRLEVGEVTRTDVSFLQARVESARAEVAAAEGDLAQARAEYRAVTGQNPGRLSAGSPIRLTRGQAEAERYAQVNHPAVVEQRHNVAAAEFNVTRAEASMKPRTVLQGQVGVNQDFGVGQSLALQMTGPVYSGGALPSQVRQAMARRDAARSGLHLVADNVRQEVANAYAILRVTQLAIDASDGNVRASRSAFNGLQEEVSLGARTTLDLLDAEQRLVEARLGVVSSQIDAVLASYNALAATGLLTAQHLQLPVQIYDPSYRLVDDPEVVRSTEGAALERILRRIQN